MTHPREATLSRGDVCARAARGSEIARLPRLDLVRLGSTRILDSRKKANSFAQCNEKSGVSLFPLWEVLSFDHPVRSFFSCDVR